jgi:organic radical activating enzyme
MMPVRACRIQPPAQHGTHLQDVGRHRLGSLLHGLVKKAEHARQPANQARSCHEANQLLLHVHQRAAAGRVLQDSHQHLQQRCELRCCRTARHHRWRVCLQAVTVVQAAARC